MLRQKDIAAALGVDKSLVSRYVKRGMPLASVDTAMAWKTANIRPRATSAPGCHDAPVNPAVAEPEEAAADANYADALDDLIRFAQRDVERYLPIVDFILGRTPEEQLADLPYDPNDGVPQSFWDALEAYVGKS